MGCSWSLEAQDSNKTINNKIKTVFKGLKGK